VADYEDLVGRLQVETEEDAIEMLRLLRRSKDAAEGLEIFKNETFDVSASPSDEGRGSVGSPSAFMRDSSSDTSSFRGSAWHPALQLRGAGPRSRALIDFSGNDNSQSSLVRLIKTAPKHLIKEL
jgi:hypothetical protein